MKFEKIYRLWWREYARKKTSGPRYSEDEYIQDLIKSTYIDPEIDPTILLQAIYDCGDLTDEIRAELFPYIFGMK